MRRMVWICFVLLAVSSIWSIIDIAKLESRLKALEEWKGQGIFDVTVRQDSCSKCDDAEMSTDAIEAARKTLDMTDAGDRNLSTWYDAIEQDITVRKEAK